MDLARQILLEVEKYPHHYGIGVKLDIPDCIAVEHSDCCPRQRRYLQNAQPHPKMGSFILEKKLNAMLLEYKHTCSLRASQPTLILEMFGGLPAAVVVILRIITFTSVNLTGFSADSEAGLRMIVLPIIGLAAPYKQAKRIAFFDEYEQDVIARIQKLGGTPEFLRANNPK